MSAETGVTAPVKSLATIDVDNSQKITHLLVRAPGGMRANEVRDLQDALRESLAILDMLADMQQFDPVFVRGHAIEFIRRCKGQEFVLHSR